MTTANRLTIPEEALREMKKPTHLLSSLNGQGKEAADYIVPQKFSSIAAIEVGLKEYCGNATGPMAFNNETKYLDDVKTIKEELMPHMTLNAIFKFLMAKQDDEKKAILEKVIGFLAALATAEVEAGKVTEMKELAENAVKSAKGMLAKVQKPDPDIEKKVLDAIKATETEIYAEHPGSQKLKKLTEDLDAIAGQLTDNSELDAAKEEAVQFIAYADKELGVKDLPPGTKDFFTPKLDGLLEIAKGKNPYAIRAEIESLGKELHQKTSKKLLTKDTSLDFVTKSMMRLIMIKLFRITDITKFSEVIQKIFKDHVEPTYTQYVAGLGRLAKSSSKQDEVYGEICLHTFSLVTDELIKVVQGNKDLSITHTVPHTVPFNVVDKTFSDLQIYILEMKQSDIESDTKRYTVSENLIKKIREFIKERLISDAGLDESQVNILVSGLAFENALRLIPQHISDVFRESIKPTEVKKVES